MRIRLILALSLIGLVSKAFELDNRTMTALGCFSQGYMQYGAAVLKSAAGTNAIAAQYYLAVCYENGLGFEKNLAEAFKYYRKAAERGLPDAMYHISMFYRDGIVVDQDPRRESEWMNRFNKKGGQLLFPDLLQIYNEGRKHPENFALNPNGSSPPLMAQNNPTSNNPSPVINNIMIVQQQQAQVVNMPSEPTQPVENGKPRRIKSDVDLNVPAGSLKHKNTFVLIIANENYQDLASVPFAHSDGESFNLYCEKTLAVPADNIRFVKDATLNNIKRQINWLKQVIEAYHGEAKIIFYYAGHGMPDEDDKTAYLLPVDGDVADASTGFALERLYGELGSVTAQQVTVILDACFSGSKREGDMLASARGVAIKAKPSAPKGNMIVLSAAQGVETAYPYREKGHGMFTYFLLKKLQETQGKATLGDIADFVIDNVSKRSIVTNGKSQTPTVTVSQRLDQSWRSLTL